jgi:tetratricopeptide (TPR) repeat protein
MVRAGEPQDAARLYREALELDPDFAAAWLGLGTAYGNMGQLDSARAGFREAKKRPERLSDAARLELAAKMAMLDRDPAAALESYRALLRLDPTPVEAAAAHNNLGIALTLLERPEEALASYRRGAALWPIQVPVITRSNIAETAFGLGRLDEVEQEASHLPARRASWYHLLVSQARREWARADTLASGMASDPEVPSYIRLTAEISVAASLVARGRIDEGRRRLEDAQHGSEAGKEPDEVSQAWWERAWLATLVGTELPAIPASLPATHQGLRALRGALEGDSASFASGLAQLDSLEFEELRHMTRGWLEVRRRRWPEAARALAPIARQGRYGGVDFVEQMRQPSRWLAADAFEQLGEPDSAAFYLGLMLQPPTNPVAVWTDMGLSDPFVLRRLVLLEARRGNVVEARRHWDRLAASVTAPDQEMTPLLDEARAVLVNAEGMRASTGR